ncbi:sorting nexin-11 [Chaetodon auriga]|uniref:sorting nexin-11 n=1 Tax=Chaetodon auriga TaxID=39042 RepID=UPI004032DAF2
MISNQEDEFVAVRVQDPRIQNEGSWNSYVDYKIFLHTNSKAFTAKTSCVRRRYSEFAWLKKKLQKNAGLVPVPDLPGKSFFSFSNEDFLEGRRRGLQAFLDKVVHMTVCLSDSQLHLFLQTQLPVGHIQDCVQGHTPYSVTDAILTYASSNQGFAQAQEDDSIKEPSLTISYESMESPAPHQPSIQTKETVSPELVPCPDSDPLEGVPQLCDEVTAESQHEEKSSVRVLQRNNHLEAVVEDPGPTEASFFLGDGQDDPESPRMAAQPQQRSCQIQTPVEVHSPMGAGFEVNCGVEEVTLDAEEKAVPHPDAEKDDGQESSEEADTENSSETEKDSEDVLGDVCSEQQVSENQVTSEVNGLEHVGDAEGHVSDVSCPDEAKNSDRQKEPDSEERVESSKEETHVEIQGETQNVHSVSQVESGGDERAEQEVALFGTRDESDEDSHSLPSSNGSIVKVSDEESVCDENEDSIHANNGYMKTSPQDVTLWSDVEASSRNILDLHMNGCSVEDEDVSTQEDEKLSKSLDLISSVTAGDLTENSDFSILETSCSPGLADRKCTERDTLSSLSVDASEETHEVEAH